MIEDERKKQEEQRERLTDITAEILAWALTIGVLTAGACLIKDILCSTI